MTRLLITGFGPFPGVPRNPTAELARSLAADPMWRRRGIAARALVLPTAWRAIEEMLLPVLRAERPQAVLMLGVAARRRAVCLERDARNRITRRLPDASGRRPARLSLEPGAPLRRRGRAAMPVLLAAMRAAGRPGAARLSRDAGRYLCNGAYFAALTETAGWETPPALVFVHVPMPRTGRGRPEWFGGARRLDGGDIRRIVSAAGLALAREARRGVLRTRT